MGLELETLDDIRAAVALAREEAKKMASHLKRMMEEYGDFEDRINAIDQAIQQAEADTGLTKTEIIEPPNVIDDLMEGFDYE